MMICSHEMGIGAMVYLHLLCRHVCVYFTALVLILCQMKPVVVVAVIGQICCILYIVMLPNHYEYTG
jgi:hypothetical protein